MNTNQLFLIYFVISLENIKHKNRKKMSNQLINFT